MPQEEMLLNMDRPLKGANFQGAMLHAPQEETLLTTEMRLSKEQIVLCDKKKCY